MSDCSQQMVLTLMQEDVREIEVDIRRLERSLLAVKLILVGGFLLLEIPTEDIVSWLAGFII